MTYSEIRKKGAVAVLHRTLGAEDRSVEAGSGSANVAVSLLQASDAATKAPVSFPNSCGHQNAAAL